jgi:hypothetical protein
LAMGDGVSGGGDGPPVTSASLDRMGGNRWGHWQHSEHRIVCPGPTSVYNDATGDHQPYFTCTAPIRARDKEWIESFASVT